MSRIFLFILFFCLIESRASIIIIADEQEQTKIFNSSPETVTAFADSICINYSGAVIHLGQSFVFRKGNIYTTPTAQSNLALFCNKLYEKNKKVFLWFFDSYGSENFLKIYANYQSIIDENIDKINQLQLKYTGVVVDLEWINLNTNNDNNASFVEVMKYLKLKTQTKDIRYFCSLIDNETVNIKRGYNIAELADYNVFPIEMLYLKDGGFYIHNHQIVPYINDIRIKQLKSYFKKHKWDVAISLEEAWFLKNGKEIILLKNPVKIFDSTIVMKKMGERKYKNFTIISYQLDTDITMKSINNTDVLIVKNTIIEQFKVNRKILDATNFEWEYFLIKSQ